MDKPDIAPPLPDSAAVALAHAARLLSDGFTGEIVLRCQDGGVRQVEEKRQWRPAELRPKAA